MTDLQTLARIRIREQDSSEIIAQAREEGRILALQLGFAPSRVLMVTTVISELARNDEFKVESRPGRTLVRAIFWTA